MSTIKNIYEQINNKKEELKQLEHQYTDELINEFKRLIGNNIFEFDAIEVFGFDIFEKIPADTEALLHVNLRNLGYDFAPQHKEIVLSRSVIPAVKYTTIFDVETSVANAITWLWVNYPETNLCKRNFYYSSYFKKTDFTEEEWKRLWSDIFNKCKEICPGIEITDNPDWDNEFFAYYPKENRGK